MAAFFLRQRAITGFFGCENLLYPDSGDLHGSDGFSRVCNGCFDDEHTAFCFKADSYGFGKTAFYHTEGEKTRIRSIRAVRHPPQRHEPLSRAGRARTVTGRHASVAARNRMRQSALSIWSSGRKSTVYIAVARNQRNSRTLPVFDITLLNVSGGKKMRLISASDRVLPDTVDRPVTRNAVKT